LEVFLCLSLSDDFEDQDDFEASEDEAENLGVKRDGITERYRVRAGEVSQPPCAVGDINRAGDRGSRLSLICCVVYVLACRSLLIDDSAADSFLANPA